MALVQVAEALNLQCGRIDIDKRVEAVDSDGLSVNTLCERRRRIIIYRAM